MSLDETDWARLRADFPTTGRFSYLNLANKAILPRQVESAMQGWMNDIYEHAGASAFSMDGIEHTREAVASLFGVPPACLALVKNTSEGVNIVAQGFPWEPGDNVVLSELEHENNTFPWRHLARRGVELRFARADAQGRIDVDAYEDLVDERTRVLAVAWVTYGTGYRAPLRRLSAWCRARGIKLMVDGIQAVGILADPIASLGVDVLIAGGHKAQFSLAGAGFMYATPEMIQTLTPPYAAKFSFDTLDRTVEQPTLSGDAHRFEYGNPNFLGCWVQRHSARYIADIGLSNIESRVRELTTYLMEAADRRQVTVCTPRAWEQRAGIVSIATRGRAEDAVARLAREGVVVAHKDDRVRASLHFYNDHADIDRFIDGVAGL